MLVLALGLVMLTIYIKNRTYTYTRGEMAYVVRCLGFLQPLYYGTDTLPYQEKIVFGRDCAKLPGMSGPDWSAYRSHIDYKKSYYIVHFEFDSERSLVFNSLTDDYSKYTHRNFMEKYNGFYRANLNR